ncbi:hypothetical protein PUNSTDRAFT_122841 [Punctularia strigosozonata HHB-11173 SS5]|uniref:Uncharacterized protein n=1 Tax=Punctularia strigosozonata (strain HHB-11173) TaxID=741275 RepID=R7S588_PUNST|nr:uncharacterized protein PUNSTDRAFT_122841 [Punctularia strigosozonata HHB-11173 SS5]EIN04516.1 hypothetical protein PUNSTDRAFT_122841 [Punctularia strigosozonata HHB-11173 SS5]
MDYDAYDALLHHVFQETQDDAWFKPTEENIHGGVCLRVEPGRFRGFPYENHLLQPFEAAVKILNPVIAVKLRSAAVNAAIASIASDANAIYLDSETRIQILETMPQLGRADKEQCGAFIRDERVLVIWSDALDNILPLYRDFEDKLIRYVWRNVSIFTSMAYRRVFELSIPVMQRLRFAHSQTAVTVAPSYVSAMSAGSSQVGLTEKAPVVEDIAEASANLNDEQKTPVGMATVQAREQYARDRAGKRSWWSFRSTGGAASGSARPEKDLEKNLEERPIRLFAPAYNGLAAALSIFFLGSGLSLMIQEYALDHSPVRFALMITSPFLFCVALFFALQVVGQLSCILGPVAHYHENSKYYSAVKPSPNKAVDAALPHITIEMPVYKESLEQTIAPSVFSLKRAMQTYARQGGTSAIFIHDDGMQLISEADRKARMSFYADHNIGWVARPGHSNEPDGFKRAGRFKKASNMNYGLAMSLKMERILKEMIERGEDDEEEGGPTLEDKALACAVEETFEESGRRYQPWARNGRSIRVGDVILIVDSDTVVPEDCLRDAARELAECPDVAIIQHESGVMQVAHHYFENGITHFTRRINKCISMVCANGEVAPFVGHNAFLRWSALQDAAFVDPADGKTKIWSETNVSEDFDMAMRLQLKGYIIRWATYSGGGFEEGVSLTPDDELNRWEKYAYGCNELIFNPLKDWWRLGPINKQLRIFVWSDAPVHYKISMMSYMFSYYGIAVSFILTVLNFLLVGWAIEVDAFYLHSFEIWLACVVVFPCAGNLGFTLLEYRLGQRSFLDSLAENLKWIPFFFFFFGGLSIHLSKALLAHLFSYNIQWGATKKEVERSNFFVEIPRIFKRFWLSFVVCGFCVAAMIVLTLPVMPMGWRIDPSDWDVIFPMALVVGCHILFPIVLNPWMTTFSY